MKPSDETLMAYADGELDAATRAQVEAAIAADPDLAQRVARHRALRAKLSTTFHDVLNEPVPERLVGAVRNKPSAEPRKADVTDLARVRAAKRQGESPARRWGWPEWASMAASLFLGVAVGYALLRPPGQIIANHDGRLIAQGALHEALSHQLAGEAAQESPVQMGVSYLAKTGSYCRAFTTLSTRSMAGIACHEDGEWTVQILSPAEAAKTEAGAYRTASTALPATVVKAIGDQIEGEPLDAGGETAARDSGWQK